jgi:hypothetical protein
MNVLSASSTAVASSSARSEPRSRGLFWALLPVLLLTLALAGLGTMAAIATRDPGFSLERDYYQRAVHWDREQAQLRENQRLGYRLTLDSVDGGDIVVRLRDSSGRDIKGASIHAEAFANARAANVRELAFSEDASGAYRGRLDSARPGLWEFRFRVERAKERFTEVVRGDVPAGARP